MKRGPPITLRRKEEVEKAKRLQALPSYDSILEAIKEIPLQSHQLQNLSQIIQDRVVTHVNQLTQHFPFELWSNIFHKASFHKLPLKGLLSYRTVCNSWNKIICCFQKINTQGLFNLSRLQDIFRLPFWSLGLHRGTPPPDFRLFTALQELKIHEKAGEYYSSDLNEFSILTNLTRLTISTKNGFITSLGPLTNLQYLKLKGTKSVGITQAEIQRLPHLTLLVAGKKTLFTNQSRGVHQFMVTNGDVYRYDGGWKEGVYHGEGSLVCPQSNYVGRFEKGAQSGHGVWTWGEVGYEGNLKEGDFDGFGTYWYEAKGRPPFYEGEWKKDKRDGRGTHAGGAEHGFRRWTGTWSDDMWEGHGEVWFAEEDPRKKFQGRISGSGVPKGKGVMYMKDGKKIDGYFINGKRYDKPLTRPMEAPFFKPRKYTKGTNDQFKPPSKLILPSSTLS